MQLDQIFSVRNSLFGVVGVLIVAVVAITSFGSLDALNQRDAASRISESNLTADLLLVSGGNWAVERGITNAAIAGAEPVAQATRAKIDARRTTADEALGKALERLKSAPDFADKDQLIGAVEEAIAKVVQLRGVVDPQLELPRSGRDAAQIGEWVPTVTGLILQSQALRVAVSAELANDPVTSQLAMLKHFAWVMSEFAGRERAVVGGTIGRGTRMPAKQMQTLNGYRGRVETAWDTVRDIAGNDNIDAVVQAAVSEANANYFGTFQQTRESVYQAGLASAQYPVSASDWISAATKAIDSILALREASSAAWKSHGTNLEANQLTDQFIIAAGNWAVERGTTNAGLSDDQPVGAERRQGIDGRRAKADAAFEQAMDLVARAPGFSGKSSLLQAVKDARAALAALRAQVDDALAKPKADRDPAVQKAWVPTITALIQESQSLRSKSTQTVGAADPAVAGLMAIKHSAWLMAEFAGRERAAVAGVIAANSQFTDQQLRTLSTFRGRVEGAWATVRELASAPGMASAVTRAVAELDAAFFGAYEQTRQAVAEAASSSAAYPMSAAEWVGTATGAIDSLLAIQTAATTATDGYNEALAGSAAGSLIFNIILLIVALVVGAGSIWMVAFRVVRPVNAMTGAMTDLAGGNLSVEIPAADRRDEIGKMGQAVQVFKDSAIERERLEGEAKQAAVEAAEREQREREAEAEREREAREAEAEREREVREREEAERQRKADEAKHQEEERQAMMLQLADSFEASVGSVVQSVSDASGEIKSAAGTMASTAEESSAQSTAVATASEEAAANVQTVASAAEQLSSSIAEISRQVAESSAITGRAVDEADRTNTSVEGLAEAAQKIDEVVNLINDIASQTNLLALNATIEAARAGDAGKGFAVVASEVKSLANQTAKATDEIARQITGMQSVTGDVVNAIKGIGGTIAEVSEIATSIASAVEEQGTATQEIANNVQQASQGTQEVNANITGVSTAAAESGTAANQMLASAGNLADQSDTLRAEVEKFLAQVRAA